MQIRAHKDVIQSADKPQVFVRWCMIILSGELLKLVVLVSTLW